MCRFAHVRVKSNRGGNEWHQVFFKMRKWKYYYDVGKIYQFIISFFFSLGKNELITISINTYGPPLSHLIREKIKYQYYSSWELFNPKHCSFPDLFFFLPFVTECVIPLSNADHALESTTCLPKKIVTRRDEGYITNMFKQ